MFHAVLARIVTSRLTLPTLAGYWEMSGEQHTVPASESHPYLQISLPAICEEGWAYRWGIDGTTSEMQHLRAIRDFLKRESSSPLTTYSGSDAEFHAQDSVFGFGEKLAWLYRLVQSCDIRISIPCETTPELFMLMVEANGLPNLEGPAAIAYARFLGESLTSWRDEISDLGRQMRNGYLVPQRAKIEVHRQTRPASWPRTTGREEYGPYQVTVSVDPTYRKALIGTNGCNARAITKALSAMTDATVHLQINVM